MSASWHMCVLIPARDEEGLLPQCLTSVLEARKYLSLTTSCDIVVAVDCSTDKTFDIASKMLKDEGAVVALNAGAVGEARTLAAEVALRRYDGPLDRCWLAKPTQIAAYRRPGSPINCCCVARVPKQSREPLMSSISASMLPA
jgi:hypothetical protein